MPVASAGGTVKASDISKAVTTVYYKTADVSRSSTTTLADDNELVGMPLTVGLWRVECLLFAARVTTDGAFRHQLTFSGTTTGTFPSGVIGPQGSTADATATTAVLLGSASAFSPVNIGVQGVTSPGTNSLISRDALINVTVAGALALQWCQTTSSANALTLRAGSRIILTPLNLP